MKKTNQKSILKKVTNTKTFQVKTFDLGEEVIFNREEIHSERTNHIILEEKCLNKKNY